MWLNRPYPKFVPFLGFWDLTEQTETIPSLRRRQLNDLNPFLYALSTLIFEYFFYESLLLNTC